MNIRSLSQEERLEYKKLPGFYVMDEKWDCLIILDACRYDLFEDVNDIPGKLEKKKSLAGCTEYWIRRNFTERKKRYDDLVYISANPYVSKYYFQKYMGFLPFEIVPAWLTDWDEKLCIVKAESVNKEVLKVNERNPEKRLLIHYMQPHPPYIGKKPMKWNGGIHFMRDELHEGHNPDQSDLLPFAALGNQFTTLPELIESYKSNLEYVLAEVKKLLPLLKGKQKIIISSDHGEALGDNNHHSHAEVDHPALKDVPWFTVDIEKITIDSRLKSL